MNNQQNAQAIISMQEKIDGLEAELAKQQALHVKIQKLVKMKVYRQPDKYKLQQLVSQLSFPESESSND